MDIEKILFAGVDYAVIVVIMVFLSDIYVGLREKYRASGGLKSVVRFNLFLGVTWFLFGAGFQFLVQLRFGG